MEKFKNRVQSNLLEENRDLNPSDTGSISEALTQTLGNSNLMLSNLHQM